jgi:hypothetical protein
VDSNFIVIDPSTTTASRQHQNMRFWSCFLSFVVLAAALASASPVVHKELANLSDSTASAVMASAVISANQKIHATWSDSTAPTETAVNEELQQATMLLASMPACGVSGL